MSDPRHALWRAIFDNLSADGEIALVTGGRIYDRVPRAADHPFISFGDLRSRAEDCDPVPLTRHRLEIEVHSRQAGRREASGIAARIERLLDDAALPLAGAHLVSLRHAQTRVAPTRDLTAYRVLVRFEALTELTT